MDSFSRVVNLQCYLDEKENEANLKQFLFIEGGSEDEAYIEFSCVIVQLINVHYEVTIKYPYIPN